MQSYQSEAIQMIVITNHRRILIYVLKLFKNKLYLTEITSAASVLTFLAFCLEFEFDCIIFLFFSSI